MNLRRVQGPIFSDTLRAEEPDVLSANLALLRKIAINLVGRDQTTKASMRAKRKKAAWNDAYMLQLLVR